MLLDRLFGGVRFTTKLWDSFSTDLQPKITLGGHSLECRFTHRRDGSKYFFSKNVDDETIVVLVTGSCDKYNCDKSCASKERDLTKAVAPLFPRGHLLGKELYDRSCILAGPGGETTRAVLISEFEQNSFESLISLDMAYCLRDSHGYEE
jgi:hypothetical protein